MASSAADELRSALELTGRTLQRLPGRAVTSGLHEVKELGPSLKAVLIKLGRGNDRVRLNHTSDMVRWNRPTSQVDLVCLKAVRAPMFAVELKAWDVGHQLFDLAKICCLLAAGVPQGFLLCVAQRDEDFESAVGRDLFPAVARGGHTLKFEELIRRHEREWCRHFGRGRPEPTAVPRAVTVRSIAVGTKIEAYPGHTARAVEVEIMDENLVSLRDGRPTV